MKYLTLTLLLVGCAAAPLPVPCHTPDLDAEYREAMRAGCADLPAAECPFGDMIGDDYERKVYERCSSQP